MMTLIQLILESKISIFPSKLTFFLRITTIVANLLSGLFTTLLNIYHGTIVSKSSILDVIQGSRYGSVTLPQTRITFFYKNKKLGHFFGRYLAMFKRGNKAL